MPALSRVVFLGFQAVAFIATIGPPVAPLSALASPVPVPMPLMPHIADYASRVPVKNYTTVVPVTLKNDSALTHSDMDAPVVDHTASAVSEGVRRELSIVAEILAHVSILGQLASDASTSGNDPAFQDEVVSAIAAFQVTLSSFRNLLGDQKKGLANFDPNNPTEVALKTIINGIKDALNSIDILVYQLPIIGPILGPIVYEVKCILDNILDFLENVIDAILNALVPDLQVAITVAVRATCNASVTVADLCLMVR